MAFKKRVEGGVYESRAENWEWAQFFFFFFFFFLARVMVRIDTLDYTLGGQKGIDTQNG